LNAEVSETGNPALRETIDRFVVTTDFPAIYEEVKAVIRRLKLDRNCISVREKSCDAIRYFQRKDIRFGLIHIDGNHDSDRVTADVSLYLPRLKRGGFVVSIVGFCQLCVSGCIETFVQDLPAARCVERLRGLLGRSIVDSSLAAALRLMLVGRD
jgi:hypothetical protein